MGKASRIRLKAKQKSKHFNFDEKIINYYLKIQESIKEGFENEELKDLFIRNVLKQLCDDVIEASQNPSVCPIIEDLFKLANENELNEILSLFSKDWEKVCCSKTISFATQTLLRCCNKFLVSPNSILLKHIESIHLFLLDSLALYMQHLSASHIIRTFIETLSGIRVDSSNRNSKPSSNNPNSAIVLKETSKICKQYLHKICTEILALPKLEDHIQNYLSCPVLQSIATCSIVLDVQIQQQFCLDILNKGKLFDKQDITSNLPISITHTSSSHLVEVWLMCVNEELYLKTFNKQFKGKLFEMSMHTSANYILQKLLLTSKNQKQFARIYKELSNKIEDILACNHIKVITQMAQNCLKYDYKQQNFLKKLEKAFHCYEPEDRKNILFKLLLSLSTYEKYNEALEAAKKPDQNEMQLEINYFGSEIIQILLKFSNPTPIVTGLNDLCLEEVVTLCNDTYGCYIIEEFLRSSTIDNSYKFTFYKKLKGRYLSLACNKMGSRALDCIWKEADVKIKKKIGEELMTHADKLKSDKFGYFIYKNCAIGSLKKKPLQWTDNQNTSIKKQKLFHNYLNDK